MARTYSEIDKLIAVYGSAAQIPRDVLQAALEGEVLLYSKDANGNITPRVVVDCNLMAKDCALELDAWKKAKGDQTDRETLVRAWFLFVNCAVAYDPALLAKVFAEDKELVQTIDKNFQLSPLAKEGIAKNGLTNYLRDKGFGSNGPSMVMFVGGSLEALLNALGLPERTMTGIVSNEGVVRDAQGNGYFVVGADGREYLIGRNSITGEYYLAVGLQALCLLLGERGLQASRIIIRYQSSLEDSLCRRSTLSLTVRSTLIYTGS